MKLNLLGKDTGCMQSKPEVKIKWNSYCLSPRFFFSLGCLSDHFLVCNNPDSANSSANLQ